MLQLLLEINYTTYFCIRNISGFAITLLQVFHNYFQIYLCFSSSKKLFGCEPIIVSTLFCYIFQNIHVFSSHLTSNRVITITLIVTG